MTGTARYASINAHMGFEQSRRDDLEAVGHMMFYFLRGSLPWSGLQARTLEDKLTRIRERKEKIPISKLCAGQPKAFEEYLSYCRKLAFKKRPDYDWLQQLFRELRLTLVNKGGKPLQDHDLQWNDGKDLGPLAPLERVGGVRQPDDDLP